MNWWQQCCDDLAKEHWRVPLTVPWCTIGGFLMHLLPRLGENRKPDGSQLLVCPQWCLSHFQNFVTMCCVTYKHHHLERQEITLTNMKNVDISMEAGKVLSQRYLALLYAMIPNKARRNGQNIHTQSGSSRSAWDRTSNHCVVACHASLILYMK